jgi:hypothetical protein
LKKALNKSELEERLLAKNTLQVARTLAREFVKLFGEKWGNVAEVGKKLLPTGKADTWGNLDRNITVFCKQFYLTFEEDNEKIKFFDNVRFMLEALPQRQDYKLLEEKKEYKSKKDIAEHFVLCSLCWRSVKRKPLEKKTPLCHIHDIQSTSSEYRKRMRMKKQVEAVYMGLFKSLPPLGVVRNDLNLNENEYLQGMCLNEASPLPHLVQYLRSQNLPLGSGVEILQALEHPIYWTKMSPLEIEAWNFYFNDRGTHFKLNYIKILLAEAWLSVEENYKHGGKRQREVKK